MALPMMELKQSIRSGTHSEMPSGLPFECTAGGKSWRGTGHAARPAPTARATPMAPRTRSIDDRQTAITVTDFVTRYGSSASGPPSDP